MSIKVIWLIDGLGYGGAEQLMATLLNSFDKSRFEMRVCVLQERKSNIIPEKLKQLGIPVDFVSIKRLRNPLNIFRIITYLRKYEPNIVHTQLEFSDTLGNSAAKFLGIPSVSTLHTIETPTVGTRTYWRQQIRWFVLRNFCTRIITVSEKTREHYIQLTKIPATKIVTMYNGIDLEKFRVLDSSISNKIRSSLEIPNKSSVICTIAVLRELKGIQFMIEALPAILERIPNVFYLVIGDGDYVQQLKSLVVKQDIEERVVFVGHRTDIPELLASSDVFVLPTLGDALPTVLIEALAAEKPIIASNVGGVPEIITNEVTGILVPPADTKMLATACLRVLQNKSLAKNLAENGYQTVKQKFDVDTQVNQLSTLYQQLNNNSKK